MIFEKCPKVYKRISQGLIVLSVIGGLKIGLNLVGKNYGLVRYYLPRTIVASSLVLLSNIKFKNLEKKLEQENDSK